MEKQNIEEGIGSRVNWDHLEGWARGLKIEAINRKTSVSPLAEEILSAARKAG